MRGWAAEDLALAAARVVWGSALAAEWEALDSAAKSQASVMQLELPAQGWVEQLWATIVALVEVPASFLSRCSQVQEQILRECRSST